MVFKYMSAGMLGLAVCSCSPVIQPSLNSSDPQARINAVIEAAERQDEAAVPHLVDLLDDDDAAVRLFAVLALEKITGTRRGYDYAAPAWERGAAVQRWREWLRETAGPEGAEDWATQTGEAAARGGG
ncbi:MAG: HEAT repeat domain-containing protein [Phycisphaerales bacterium]|nr:MAG: HEAT repeat domain-containing protein [Phycisphaerales bacterium]